MTPYPRRSQSDSTHPDQHAALELFPSSPQSQTTAETYELFCRHASQTAPKQKATLALAMIKAAKSFDEAEAAWTDFLVAAGAIYSKLEQGAKGHNTSEPWFGRKKKIRKDDPLLRYIHFARNSNEHGIERVVGISPPNRDGRGRRLKFNERVPVQFKTHDPQTMELQAEGEGFFAGPSLKPIVIYDRKFGRLIDLLGTHLGNAIKLPNFIDGIADAALVYLTSLVAEAEALV